MRTVLPVGVALYFLVGYGVTARDLWSSHEARAAMNGASLLTGAGPPLVPRLFDGTPELQKPPLYYALVAAFGWLLGDVDALAVRLPAILTGLGTVVLLGLWLASRGRPLLGLLAATVLATGIHFTLLTRTGRIDMPLTFVTLAALIAFVEAIRLDRRRYLLVGYVALACGALLKGPIAIVLVAAALLPWMIVERPASWREMLARLQLWWGIPLVGLLVLPWLFWIDLHTDGAFFRVFLWEHNLERGLGTGRLRSYPGWYYVPLLATNGLPWSPILFAAIPLALWRGWHRTDAELRAALVSLAGLLLLLSLAAFKRADYLAPLYPLTAIIVATALERTLFPASSVNPGRRGLALSLSILFLAGVGQVVYAHTELARVEPRREQATFAATICRHRAAQEPVTLFRTECHLLAFHLGPGTPILVQWPDLIDRVRRVGPLLVVTLPETAREVAARPDLCVERLSDNGVRHDRPLVLLRLRFREGDPSCPNFPSCPRWPTSP